MCSIFLVQLFPSCFGKLLWEWKPENCLEWKIVHTQTLVLLVIFSCTITSEIDFFTQLTHPRSLCRECFCMSKFIAAMSIFHRKGEGKILSQLAKAVWCNFIYFVNSLQLLLKWYYSLYTSKEEDEPLIDALWPINAAIR